MRVVRLFIILIGSAVVLFVALATVYLLSHRQRVISSSEIKTPGATKNVLIASQGSTFKNGLVESLRVYLQKRPYNLKIIDVTMLGEIDEADWDALVLIHTTEKWQLQPDVKKYLDRAKDLSKVVLVTTSGNGRWKTRDYKVDAITSASKKNELSSLTALIIDRIEMILANP